ncbi:hypothetical protein FYK55_13320 [Roseiconus nitratireducens]|uniref:Tetratricopeptide repeat protein n=1 Tax=Roseiconus nitratireducens TaxID=2605748 RepID=A0A5M6D6V0_9BACT|nr:hypothetical protein [Roseiconus nitratireducens]KAA5543251.1 hypothetical protein FYK55_13320 [Roseiconus nitratireducens]
MTKLIRAPGFRLVLALAVSSACLTPALRAEGEPAEAFIKQLRNAGYFDTAIAYLERADQLPGVDPSFVAAIPLEKAQTYIDMALRSRNAEARDEAFANAEAALQQFLTDGDHPRASEARLQLGKLQMIRAAQLLAGEPDPAKQKQAKQSYLAASKTFDGIVGDLRQKLEQMRGQKIDPATDPQAAALRDQYRFEFLQSQLNAAEAITLAAKTDEDPAKNAKSQLQDAAKRFTELNEKYASYVPGALALMHLGQVNELQGNDQAAMDRYLEMLDQPDAAPLRDAKFLAASGLIRLYLKSDPPKYSNAIDRVGGWVREIRPNEESTPSVQEFRMELAKAYLAKAADDSLKKGEIGRAKSEGRQLLLAASKVPGPHVEQAQQMLADLGIEQDTETLPTAEPPKSFDDAMEKAREVLQVTSDLEKALEILAKRDESNSDLQQQKDDIEQQIRESRSIGIQTLRAGLAMINSDTDNESVNQARQILTYFLYQDQKHRDAAVVGSFLARNAPGSDVGLKGGLMALTSLQMLLSEVPEEENGGLISQLESLGDYLSKTWPNDPQAAAAKGIQIRLMLQKDDFQGAKELIDQMAAGNERAMFRRLLGQLLWNQSIMTRSQKNDPTTADRLVGEAKASLQAGLDGIEGNLVETEGMQAAAVLAKVHLLLGESSEALKVLDHPKYGPLNLLGKIDAPSENFAGDVYSTELKALVGQMLNSQDPGTYLDRMTKTMETLRESFDGPESQTRLTQTYMRLASDLREQLDSASPAKRGKLIEAFREMLKRISDSTSDQATLRWVGQTLMSMGESLMEPGQNKATGQAADLISQAAETFKSLDNTDDVTTAYLLARSQRLVGEYKDALDALEKILVDKPTMLDAQFEGAQAYESWAGELKPAVAYKAYTAALTGARPNDTDKQNTIWGWAKISKQTNRNPAFKEKFFESRYHVALCLFLMGRAADRDSDIRKAIKDIKQIATLYPEMGGPAQRGKYNALLKEAQRAVGDKPTGLETPSAASGS